MPAFTPVPTVSIEFRRDIVDISTRGHHIADPKWSTEDTHGHVHRFVGEALSTLEWVVSGTHWCDTCSDDHEEGEWHCRICGDRIEPHYNFTGPYHEQIPELATTVLWLDQEPYPITMDDAASLRKLEGDALVEAAKRLATMRGTVTRPTQLGEGTQFHHSTNLDKAQLAPPRL